MLTALELHERARAANTAWRFKQARHLLLKALQRTDDVTLRAIIHGTYQH